MSALTEKVAREHPPFVVGRQPDVGIGCRRCSHAEPYQVHIAAVTEAATRAAVAADIRAQVRDGDLLGTYEAAVNHGLHDAARIAEGKRS